MTAPDSRPDVESTLSEAFRRRHTGQPAARPSLVDVRRRAHRRSTRRAAARTGAVVAAGAAVLTGGWAVTRGDSSPAAAPAVPADGGSPSDGVPGEMVTTLSVDGLWEAVAAQLGVTAADLRRANPTVDFGSAPAPGMSIAVPAPGGPIHVPTTAPAPSPTFVQILTTTSFVLPPQSTSPLPGGEGPSSLDVAPTTTVVRAVGGSPCVLDDAQALAMADYARSTPSPGSTMQPPVSAPALPAGCMDLPPLPQGWTFYAVATGDYLYGIAERFCTSGEELVAGNGWSGVDLPLLPGQLVAVPADAC